MTRPLPFSGVLFGAAYYVEYQREGSLDRDLDLMGEAGFTVIRVGESVWSTWEPREGEFALEWLQPVLDGAHARGIGVILGTPTYAIPPWLQRRHPEIAAETSDGRRIPWGARQEMDQSQPAYRFYAERIVRRVVERYATHPAVIGFQVDNEPGFVLPHNESTFQRFVDWLRSRYGTVDRLNEEWGLVYWSHRLSDWSDLWRPAGNSLPEYQLEWRRFQGSLATELIAWQADVVREYARDDQFVTTCISYSRPQVSDDEITAVLDVAAGNPYYRMQRGLDLGIDDVSPERWWHTGVWALYEWADRAWSSADAPYLVTETNAQSIGPAWDNRPPFPGQLKQVALALLSRGGRMVEYWHWHTLHFGTESHWGGVLPHSQEPGRIYRELAALGADLKALGPSLDDYEPDAEILMLWSTDTSWSFDFAPPLSDRAGGPDRDAYQHIFGAFYRGVVEAGAQVRIQHSARVLATPAEDLAARFPILIAPALYVASDELLDHLRSYVGSGGHLVVGMRTGYGDGLARPRREVAPGRLSDLAGVRYDEYSNLDAPLPALAGGAAALDLEDGSAATDWVDVLQVEDAEVLVRSVGTELGADALITTRGSGPGRVTYVATVPNPPLARSLGRWLVPRAARTLWDAGVGVTVTTGSTPRRRCAFIANWDSRPSSIRTPREVRDLLSGAVHPAGSVLHLDPRSSLVLESRGDSSE